MGLCSQFRLPWHFGNWENCRRLSSEAGKAWCRLSISAEVYTWGISPEYCYDLAALVALVALHFGPALLRPKIMLCRPLCLCPSLQRRGKGMKEKVGNLPGKRVTPGCSEGLDVGWKSSLAPPFAPWYLPVFGSLKSLWEGEEAQKAVFANRWTCLYRWKYRE